MVRGRVGNVMRVMVHRGRRRGCRDIAPPCRCLFPPAGIRPCAPLAEGAGAGGGAAPVLYGVSPGPPGLGPGTPTAFPPDGLAACAQAGAESASAAITATPPKRCFVRNPFSPSEPFKSRTAEGTGFGSHSGCPEPEAVPATTPLCDN
jgi:hypothetical protein